MENNIQNLPKRIQKEFFEGMQYNKRKLAKIGIPIIAYKLESKPPKDNLSVSTYFVSFKVYKKDAKEVLSPYIKLGFNHCSFDSKDRGKNIAYIVFKI
jgi:hypothetical protein